MDDFSRMLLFKDNPGKKNLTVPHAQLREPYSPGIKTIEVRRSASVIIQKV